jgi:hypothetical protein
MALLFPSGPTDGQTVIINNVTYVYRSSITAWDIIDRLVVTNTQVSNYTLSLSDAGKIIEMNSSSPNNVTVPLNSVAAFPIGSVIDILQYGTGQTSIVAESGVTLRSLDGLLSLATQYAAASLYKRGTNEWVVIGNLS